MDESTHRPQRIGYFATDGSIPLNFMPLPEAIDSITTSTPSDAAIDRELDRVHGWLQSIRRSITGMMMNRRERAYDRRC